MKWIAMAVCVALAAGCSAHRTGPDYLPSAGAPRPYSPVVRANGFVFLAGQLGTDSTGRLAPGGIQPETRQALTNVRALLLRGGSSMDRVVKCTVFLADVREWAAMNEAYTTFFPAGRYPARTALGVAGLPMDARVEIECLATD